jgi:hypothetical protein
MADYGFLYVIDTSYHTERQVYKVDIGYMDKDEEVKGRFITINIMVNIPNHKSDESKIKELAISKARKLLELASKASVGEGG